jgi:hypothetical protein
MKQKSDKNIVKQATVIIIVIVLFVVGLIATMIVLGDGSQSKSSGDVWNGEQQITVQGNSEHIGVPCFSSMYFKADSYSQKVNLYNPEGNNFIVSMTLKLNDGTILWSAKNIHPNHGFYDIEISKKLSIGEYKDCELVRHFYTMGGKETSNPLSTKFTLFVN